MAEKMTLEQVRDWHLARDSEQRIVGFNLGATNHRGMADAIDAHLAQPAQAVDVDAACMSMYPDWSKYHQHERETFRKEMKQAITRAIGNAQADD